ncbi:MAG: hypothetical protein ACI9UN_000585 [Granulosicoccus sp.]|jgi:hypothetical protein
MKLYLTSAYSVHTCLDRFRDYAQLSSSTNHSVCNDPSEADAILFVENTQFADLLFKALLKHPLVQEFEDKVFMYNEVDRPWDTLPGLYCCMTTNNFNPNRHRAFGYLHTPNPYIGDIHEQDIEKRWLYSFVGSMSHSCRRPIMRLRDDSGYVQDTSDFNVWDSYSSELEIRGQSYANILAASQFVLCPRGIGSSSIRLFETMRAGRVPVIISDDWVPPCETDWSFAIKFEERRISSIPGFLKTLQNESEERGQAARKAWEQSYAPDTLFNTAGDLLDSLLASDAHKRRVKNGANLQKWLTTGELLTRAAAQRLKG